MTRKEKHEMALDLAEDYLNDESERTSDEIIEAIRFARGRGECPPWWAEVAFERHAVRREDREEAAGGPGA